MITLNSPSCSTLNLDRPPPVDLSERIWNLHRTITESTVQREKVKDAKRTLLGALIVQNELRNIVIPPLPATSAPAPSKAPSKTAKAASVCEVCGSADAARPASERNRISKRARASSSSFRANHFPRERRYVFARRGRTQPDRAPLISSREALS